MGTISVILVMLLAVVASGYLARMSPIPLPLPLVQIALGFGIAFSTDYRVELDPEILFLLFIPPLLFLDGPCAHQHPAAGGIIEPAQQV